MPEDINTILRREIAARGVYAVLESVAEATEELADEVETAAQPESYDRKAETIRELLPRFV